MICTIGLAHGGSPVDVIENIHVSAIQPDTEKVVLFPNPATTTSQIKVTAENTKIIEVSIFSLLGNKLFEKAYGGNEQTIQLNVQNFKKGKYLVKIIFADGTTEVKALIKQ